MTEGTQVYETDSTPVVARGASYDEVELKDALKGPVADILVDSAGTDTLETILASVSNTGYSNQTLRRILSVQHEPEDWRVGEALAEAFLAAHRDCYFPWPTGRDLKNPTASPAGTDIVGFRKTLGANNQHRFAFAEVKTSAQAECPPTVVKCRTGLVSQLEALRDSAPVRDNLVRYLGHHAVGSNWLNTYKDAAASYLDSDSDVSIFGILIRDIIPDERDLKGRASKLASGCPAKTTIELRAIYLPLQTISKLPQLAKDARGGTNDQN